MYKVIIVSIVLGFVVPCSGMDTGNHATEENIINFYGKRALNIAKKNNSKEDVLKTQQGKAHYKLLDSVLSQPQTSKTLTCFKGYLDRYNLPIDCPVRGSTSLLDLYITNSIATGEFFPLHQYLRLGADPEYALTTVTPMNFAEGLLPINKKRARFAMCLLLIYIGRKHQTKK